MLVLTRKAGQSLIIGDGIRVTVLSVSGDKVRVGIEADRDVPILRDEVYDRMASENGDGRAQNGSKPAQNGSKPAEKSTTPAEPKL